MSLQAILELLRSPDGRHTREIAQGIGVTARTARARLAALLARGLVREVGTGPKDARRRYYLAECPVTTA